MNMYVVLKDLLKGENERIDFKTVRKIVVKYPTIVGFYKIIHTGGEASMFSFFGVLIFFIRQECRCIIAALAGIGYFFWVENLTPNSEVQ